MGLQAYYDSCVAGAWASPYIDECGCRGFGWFLSDVDTWHPCSYHITPYTAHPDVNEGYDGPDPVYSLCYGILRAAGAAAKCAMTIVPSFTREQREQIAEIARQRAEDAYYQEDYERYLDDEMIGAR
jgi:hypothetical protein